MIKNTISMNVSAIGTDDGKNTYEIHRKWGDKGKKAIVIEMYPTISAENCNILDVSTMHLLNHANDFGWSELRVLNLYATVVTGKPTVSELKDNSLAYIEEVLEEKDIRAYDIVIAWGNSLTSHQETIKTKIDLLSMLEEKGLSANVKCITVNYLNTKTSYGIHPLYLGLHYPKEQWKLIEYPLKDMMTELEKSVKSNKSVVKKVSKKTEKKEKATEKVIAVKDGEHDAHNSKKEERAENVKAN